MKTARQQYTAQAIHLLDRIDALASAVKRHAAREMRSQGGFGWVGDLRNVDAGVETMIRFLDSGAG